MGKEKYFVLRADQITASFNSSLNSKNLDIDNTKLKFKNGKTQKKAEKKFSSLSLLKNVRFLTNSLSVSSTYFVGTIFILVAGI